jgi:hypothetical protein
MPELFQMLRCPEISIGRPKLSSETVAEGGWRSMICSCKRDDHVEAVGGHGV